MNIFLKWPVYLLNYFFECKVKERERKHAKQQFLFQMFEVVKQQILLFSAAKKSEVTVDTFVSQFGKR